MGSRKFRRRGFRGESKISTTIPQLPAAIAINGSEQMEAVQAGVSVRITIAQIAVAAGSFSFSAGTTGLTPNTPTIGAVVLGGTLATTNGGTGLVSYATGDIIYASGVNTLAKLPAGSNGSVLSLVGGIPAWVAESTVGVTSFSAGTTGLTPSSPTAGPIVLAGTLGVPNGGTGLASGTSGGIPYFSATNTIASSALLTNHAIMLGGGAGAAPKVLGTLGTTTTVLHGNAAGDPTFGAVNLTADVSGILPVANGGTGSATQNFVDLTTTQATIAGVKTFTTQLIGKGTATNDSAAVGYIGEYISSNIASPGSGITSATATNVTSVSLTAGDWDVDVSVLFAPAASTVTTALQAWISTVSATLPTAPNGGGYVIDQEAFPNGSLQNLHCHMRVSVAATTTVYMGAQANFTVSTMTAYGFIGARRMR